MQHYLKNKPDYSSHKHIVKEKKCYLLNMAILFANGSPVRPNHAIQPHPIDSLNSEDLIQFMMFLVQEFKSQPELLRTLPRDSSDYLQEKIEQLKNSPQFASLDKQSQQEILSLDSRNLYPQFLSDIGVKHKKISALTVANALWLSGKDKQEINTMKYAFMLWDKKHQSKVTENDLNSCLSAYQIPN